MDPALRALCMEVIDGNIDSERFAWLLIETGIRTDTFEWQIASRLLGRQDSKFSLEKSWGDTIH